MEDWAEDRRKQILDVLKGRREPITGSELARQFQVSRQVIVQDIALLRAKGETILATPRGYLVPGAVGQVPGMTRILACVHSKEGVEEELKTIVRMGGEVVDVTVEHPLYGQLSGMLMLRSEVDVDRFMEGLKITGAKLLSSLTEGVHLHTIRVSNLETFNAIREKLRQKGFLLEDQD